MKLKVRSLIKATISQFILSTLVLGLITALTGCGGGSYGTQMGGSPVTVRGAVVDEGGHPLIGIKILDLNSGEETDTNDKGQFEISALLADGADSVPLEIDGKSLVHVPASVGYVTEAAIARDAAGEFSLTDASPTPVAHNKDTTANLPEQDPVSDNDGKTYGTGGANSAFWATEQYLNNRENWNKKTQGPEVEAPVEPSPEPTPEETPVSGAASPAGDNNSAKGMELNPENSDCVSATEKYGYEYAVKYGFCLSVEAPKEDIKDDDSMKKDDGNPQEIEIKIGDSEPLNQDLIELPISR